MNQCTSLYKGAVRSFDLFDTLLGRLHYHPDAIFDLVEHKTRFPGFFFFRKAAESKSNGTLTDIYLQFQEMTGITDEQVLELMQCEFETELNEVFLIVENRDLVQNGDLIVSDTYYDECQVKKILEKIGLNQQVAIYATPGGKSSGRIWDIIKQKHSIEVHLGDSFYSDVEMARSRDITASHYTKGQLSHLEQSIMGLGQSELACFMRALRLQNPYPQDSVEYLLWNEQCQLNVPVLMEACLYLDDFCKKHSKRRVLFTTRDGCLWIQLFRTLYPCYDSIYFHSSRYAYTFPSPSFIEYVRTLSTEDAVIVDVHGTGRSCAKFFEQHLNRHPTFLAIINFGRKHHGIVRKRADFARYEMLNYDVVGSLYDMRDNKPLRRELEYDLRFILPMHACIRKCVELLPFYTFQKFDQRVIQRAIDAMKPGLVIQRYVEHEVFHLHLPGNESLLQDLGLSVNKIFNL